LTFLFVTLILKQVQDDRIKTKTEIATGTTCPRNGGFLRLLRFDLPKARKGLQHDRIKTKKNMRFRNKFGMTKKKEKERAEWEERN